MSWRRRSSSWLQAPWLGTSLGTSVALRAVALLLFGFLSSARAESITLVPPDATCPSVDMIRVALLAAQPKAGAGAREQTVTVEVADDHLSLRLGEAASLPREIPADSDCAVRAESVAMVVAAWSGELASRPIDSPVLTSVAPAPLLAPAKAPTHVLELDGSGFYSPIWGHAPGGWLGVGRVPRHGGLGLRGLGAYQAADDVLLEGGANHVWRALFGAAVTYHLQLSRVFAAADAGVVLALTHATGSGYAPNAAATVANAGGIAELRGGLRLGRARLWLGGRVLRLVRAEEVRVQSSSPGPGNQATLRAWDLQLGVGLGFRFE